MSLTTVMFIHYALEYWQIIIINKFTKRNEIRLFLIISSVLVCPKYHCEFRSQVGSDL